MVQSNLGLLANHSLPATRDFKPTAKIIQAGGVPCPTSFGFRCEYLFPRILSPVSVCVLRFAGSKKSHEVIRFLAAERASESGQVGPAVHDPNDGLVTGEPVSDTGKIRAAMTAVSINHQDFHAIHYCVSAVHTRGATGPLVQRFRIARSANHTRRTFRTLSAESHQVSHRISFVLLHACGCGTAE